MHIPHTWKRKFLLEKYLQRKFLCANMQFKVFFLLTTFVVATLAAPTTEDSHSSSSSPEASNEHTGDVDNTTQKSLIKTGASEAENADDDEDEILDNIVSKLDVLLVEVKDDALEKCISNNETEALTKARGADEELEECFSPVVEVIVNSISDIDTFDINVFKNFSKQFCNIFPPVEKKCSTDYYHNIEPCLSEGDMKGIKLYDKMSAASVQYICQYNPDVLIEAARNGFGCNLMEHLASFVFCILPPFQEIAHYQNTSMAIPRILLGKGCRLFKDMAHCVHQELKTCKNKTYSDVIVGFFNVTTSVLPECPSERTEWEQYMGQIVGKLYKEEQEQTNLLKSVKVQMDQLISMVVQQQKLLQGNDDDKKYVEKALNSILGILNTMKEEHNSHH